ncbi:hypothetical protein PV327_008462 [Microctonus hyperodae]|uniref:Lysophospholipid acyltransferase 7 n=1 Tax=Microctonus hyperodae TaxID=165561 RepID=A0AA39F381_MICHY|nr:hypothetical protein PV327_008462 [Microctonus hyperodae]
MLIDDLIYVGILLGIIGFGSIFRNVKNPNEKKWISTAVGIFVSFIVSGWHIIHPILMTIINAAIISSVSRRTRHIVAFFFSFFYLLVISRLIDWYGVPLPPTHTNLILMIMALRYGGLGFEMNSAEDELKSELDNDYYKAITKVDFLDVIHYGFSYMGVLTGPFYRYRTYWDCINRNLSDYINCWEVTLFKLKLILLSTIIYLVTDYYFSASYVLTDEFLERSFLYRLWYVYPGFLLFRTRIYAGMLLSECACHMAGMGVYPTSTEIRSGLGPKNYKAFIEIASDPEKLKKEPMDFETIHNINIWGVESCYLVRKAMKHWNTTVQYWMANYVYKAFPYKALRAPAVFILSSVWHGYAFGYYVAIFSVVFFLPIEDIYVKFYNNSSEGSLAKKFWWTLLYCMRFSCMAYLSFAMLLLDYSKIFTYYNNVYWMGHILTIILYVVGIVLKPYLLPKIISKQQ